MDGSRDPFRVLSLSYDADSEDVRRAFRRLARRTHPDRGGSTEAFHRVRAAYNVLAEDLEGERRRWQTPREGPPTRAASPAGLDRRTYPTCLVRIGRQRDGRRRVEYDVGSRPPVWRPVATPPPGGECRLRVEATEAMPAFGVWVVPLDAHRFRCVFGPHPDA
ncbi:DnaJ domain-containing protein [Rubrivirga marina]|uniref:J domain-containing protein n=1 Tax=Rubrivirga marina TaxID=1196024 RepID=A0A271J2U4_9BACT|nr:DnaJ domain-containing protein [Rubrivirga marina]PAP77836.1 hypothetical protein BSZ37_16000 [Rubrivirga marina]